MKRKTRISKRIFTLLLVIAMLMSLMPSAWAANSVGMENENRLETQSTLPFTDVPEGQWYYYDVVYVYEKGVMIGTGNNKFEPEATVTRAQFVKAIANMAEKMGYNTKGYFASQMFKDVKAGEYYDEPMGWAKQNGILEGTGSNNAEPNSVVTREQMATFLHRYVNFLGYKLVSSKELNYSDENSVSTWAKDAVTDLTKAGVFNGIYDSTTNTYLFKPQEASTRAQMAALLHRLLGGSMFDPTEPSPSDPSPSDPSPSDPSPSDPSPSDPSPSDPSPSDPSPSDPSPSDPSPSPSPNVLEVADGENYVVSGTETYDKVILGEDASLSGDTELGYSGVTLTVDGVEMSILSGKTYTGTVVLTPVKSLSSKNSAWSAFRTAVYVDGEGINSDYSAPAAVISGEVTDTSATDVVMRSETDLSCWQKSFNGILINTSAKQNTPQGLTLEDYLNDNILFDYVISNPDIKYTGPGGNDFIGLGASVMVSGNSRALLEGSLEGIDIEEAAALVKADSNVDLTETYATNISNKGQVRTTLVAEESSVVVVDGAYTKVSDGEWIEGYVASVNSSIMKSVPWMQGLYGNVRANNLLDNATGIYYNSILEGENWGVISTDESTAVQVEVKDSIIRGTGVSTYGAYAVGKADISVTDSYMFVPTYAVIAADGSNVTEFKNTEICSGRAGAMYHSGTGTVKFIDSQVQVVRELALMRAGNNTAFNLVVDSSDISFTGTEDNILVQLMDTDEVLEFPSMRTIVDYEDPAYAYGNNDNSLETAAAYYNAMPQVTRTMNSTAAFKDADVAGDIYNSSLISGVDLAVTLDGANLKGVVSSSVGIHDKEVLVSSWDANGQTGSEDYKLLGKVTNYVFPSKGNDVTLSLTNGSTWEVTGVSYLTSLTIDSTSDIVLPAGYTIKVGGVVKSIEEIKEAGTITGAIEIAGIIEPDPVSIDIVNVSIIKTLQQGSTFQLQVVVEPANASQLVTWTSTNPEFASVDENGLVTAIKEGTVIIKAETVNGLSKTVTIRVILG